MLLISLIAVIDENNGIGFKNQLLCHLPADLKHFKKITMGKPIIMGKNTFYAIGKPLPGRKNIVLSHHRLTIEGALTCSSLNEAINQLQDEPEIMIIGGEIVFREAISIARRVYLTRIHHQFEADAFFPILDSKSWICKEQIFHPRDDKNPFDLTFYLYERINSF